MDTIIVAVIWAMLMITLINLAILGLTLKLYTEWFKARTIEQRGKNV